jgi:hypothetical protein
MGEREREGGTGRLETDFWVDVLTTLFTFCEIYVNYWSCWEPFMWPRYHLDCRVISAVYRHTMTRCMHGEEERKLERGREERECE